MARFSLALLDNKSVSKETVWILVTVFDGSDQRFAEQHFSKSDLIAVKGRPQQNRWGNRKRREADEPHRHRLLRHRPLPRQMAAHEERGGQRMSDAPTCFSPLCLPSSSTESELLSPSPPTNAAESLRVQVRRDGRGQCLSPSSPWCGSHDPSAYGRDGQRLALPRASLCP
ncbi:hypothetical protein HK107_07815 [Parvularcula sp. ZS-1/3]|uniref:Uncharacterized protein n=1 Tax=Parvularcula mediterranea TaxID=2732508 RepID=A0A7Y3W541_9PROT|nr:hypothetical protein [Parvularcula mediterranea]